MSQTGAPPVRLARPDDHAGIIALREKAFGLSRGFWYTNYPSTSPAGWSPEHGAVIEVDGRIVSHAALRPLELMIEGDRLRAGGVSGVATLPECRGLGHMSALMRYWNGRMGELGYPLGLLWGRTHRYRHFGYELAGRTMTFRLTAASVRPFAPAPDYPIRGYEPDRDLDAIMGAHECEWLRVARTRDAYLEDLAEPGLNVWVAREGEAFAYVVLEGEHAIEHGGPPRMIAPLLAYIATYLPLGELKVDVPWPSSELAAALTMAAEGWEARPTAMVMVADLEGTLRGFERQIQGRAEGLGLRQGEVTLAIEDGAAVTISVGEGVRAASPAEDAIRLSRPDMARLLFGLYPPAMHTSPDRLRLLRALFPLDFWVWDLDKV